jgi:hypothetical protein
MGAKMDFYVKRERYNDAVILAHTWCERYLLCKVESVSSVLSIRRAGWVSSGHH